MQSFAAREQWTTEQRYCLARGGTILSSSDTAQERAGLVGAVVQRHSNWAIMSNYAGR